MEKTCLCPTNLPDWHLKDVDLGGHAAHRLTFPTFFHMPLGYDSYLQRQYQDIDELGLAEPWPNLVLTRTGLFRGEIVRLLKNSESLSRHVTQLPTRFILHGYLHQGGIGTISQSTRKLQEALFDQGRMPKTLYLCHLTCPICCDAKGGDKILLLRAWKASPTLENRIQRQGQQV